MHNCRRRSGALAAAVGILVAASCSPPAGEDARKPPPEAKPAAAPESPLPPPPQIQIPEPTPPVDRRALLDAVAAAADAFATGRPPPPEAASLAGRRFEIRAPVGCQGPAKSGALRYEWNPDEHKLKMVARPQVWTDVEWAKALVGGPETEVIEGFWLSRPWIASGGCPALPPGPPEAASPETVGLAQVFDKGGSRLLRRNGRPYEFTRKLADDATPAPGGYRLVLAGRIVDAATPAIRCRSGGGDQRPTCLIRVELSRVAFEDESGGVMVDWKS